MTHGTRSGYKNHGCRCDACRGAHAAAARAERAAYPGICLELGCSEPVTLRKRCPQHLAAAASGNRRRYAEKKQKAG